MTEISNDNSSSWSENVYIETPEYIIKGRVHMPKIVKKSRLLTEILNTTKQFIAVTDCSIESKLFPQKEVEKYNFIEVNISSILIMRPIDD